jgi:hypothetical protein
MKFEIHFEFRASLRKFQDLNFRDATTIKEAPSLFSSPHCLMVKRDAKVKIIDYLNDIDDDDEVMIWMMIFIHMMV